MHNIAVAHSKEGVYSCTDLLNDNDLVLLADDGDVDGIVVGQARVFEGVDIQQVSGLGGELDAAGAVTSASLHQEGVVVTNQVPNQSFCHC
jgi:hypothetical protein